MNTTVNFEIAKLLKEKGFDTKTECWYDKDGDALYTDAIGIPSSYKFHLVGECYAPTIAEVVTWLYEKHGIWITVDADVLGFYGHYKINPIGNLSSNLKQGWTNSGTNPFNSPTEAYSVAIEYTLKNLI